MAMLPPDPVYIFKGEMDPVSCVSFRITPTAELLYAGTQTGNVHIWSLKSKREVGRLKTGTDTCLAVLPREEGEEDALATHTKTGDVVFWKEENGAWVALNTIQVDFFGFCRSQAFKGVIYAPLKGCGCQVISLESRETTRTLGLTDGTNLGELMALRVKVLDGRKVVLAAYEGQKLILWGEEDGEKLSELELEACPMAVDLDVGTRRGLCGDPTDQLLVFSLDGSARFKVERKVKLTNAGVAAVQIRPDGRLVAVGCWDGKLRLYSWKTLVLLAVLDTHSGTVQDVAFAQSYSEKGKERFLLAAASQDCRISLWNLYNS